MYLSLLFHVVILLIAHQKFIFRLDSSMFQWWESFSLCSPFSDSTFLIMISFTTLVCSLSYQRCAQTFVLLTNSSSAVVAAPFSCSEEDSRRETESAQWGKPREGCGVPLPSTIGSLAILRHLYFQFPGSATAPSTCAFSVKVESFCRLYKINYKASRNQRDEKKYVYSEAQLIHVSRK